MPKISVLMPVYNTKEQYLREAIESILNQTYTDFEFLIINDGSTNNAEQIILSYNDERIVYIRNVENLGLVPTLNYGLSTAKGEFIARMDSDDISNLTRLEKQIQFMEKNKNIDVLGSWFKTFPKSKIIKPPTGDKTIKNFLLLLNCSIAHPTVMIRKSTLERYGFKYCEEHKYAEDYGLWLSMIDRVAFANLPEVLLSYRIHQENVSVLQSKGQYEMTNKLMYESQKKLLGEEFAEELSIYHRVRRKEKIEVNEFKLLIKYVERLVDTLENHVYAKEFAMIYKSAARMCKRNRKFLELLWNNGVNKFVRRSFYFRIKNSLSGW